MCGINGILRLASDGPPVDREVLLRTRDAMAVRGPDGSGEWISADAGIGLAHNRLAIIDLSPAGHQPMGWDDGRFQITFNGEIYNYEELRAGLAREGVRFQSHSDTEVILALYAKEGAAALSRLRGMYTLAIWDQRERSLILARDPYGIKPLYYTTLDGQFCFASQVKALEAVESTTRSVNPAGLVGFLLWGSVPEPHTFREGIHCLPGGHYLEVKDGVVGEARPHYDFTARPTPTGEIDVAAALEDSVRAHLVADVPVACFLSAGLDSGLIAALAQRNLDQPLTTFTLKFDSFEGTPLDEAPLAAEVAKKLGTRHVERRVVRSDCPDLWPQALAAMDQPSIDGFNTFVVSSLAAEQGFKVVLSGLGGDELLGSYASFGEVPRWSRWAGRLGNVWGLGACWPALAATLQPGKPKLGGLMKYGESLPGSYFLRRGLFLPDELPRLVGEERAREGLTAYDPLRDAGKYLGQANSAGASRNGSWEAVHLMESTQYMRNQLLRDSDWASMAHSLELRVPLVDAKLRDALAAASFEPARSNGKAAAVRQAAPELPEALWNRPKSGFTIPVMDWVSDEQKLNAGSGGAARELARRVLDTFGVDL